MHFAVRHSLLFLAVALFSSVKIQVYCMHQSTCVEYDSITSVEGVLSNSIPVLVHNGGDKERGGKVFPSWYQFGFGRLPRE